MNDKLKEALRTGKYPCPECGNPMVFEDEKWKDSLICEECGYGCATLEYGEDPSVVEMRHITEIAGVPDTEDYEDVYDDED